MDVVKRQFFIIAWLQWHYYQVPTFLIKVWVNYLVFTSYFFSIPLLAMTLLAPWRRYRWAYPVRGFHPDQMASTFIMNVFSRLVGFFCRMILIILGMVAQVLVFVAGIMVIIGWLVLPPFVVALIVVIPYVSI